MTSFEYRLEIRDTFGQPIDMPFEYLRAMFEVFVRDRQANESLAMWVDIVTNSSIIVDALIPIIDLGVFRVWSAFAGFQKGL